MNTKYHNKTLTINNHSVVLPYVIKDLIEFENMVIILIRYDGNFPSDSRLLGRNIYAFDGQGHELWKIQQCPYRGEERRPSYTGIQKNENGELIAYNLIGFNYIVNLDNGEVTRYGTGRPW
jgi:hypothetical protein